MLIRFTTIFKRNVALFDLSYVSIQVLSLLFFPLVYLCIVFLTFNNILSIWIAAIPLVLIRGVLVSYNMKKDDKIFLNICYLLIMCRFKMRLFFTNSPKRIPNTLTHKDWGGHSTPILLPNTPPHQHTHTASH